MAERVHLLGVGLDGPAAGRDVPTEPVAVVGASRLLADVDGRWPAAERLELTDLDATLTAIDERDGEVVVLASGDPGCLGIARVLTERLGRDRVVVHPAASSVAGAFARAGVPWDDARIVSAHGRDPHAAVTLCLAHHKVAVLTEPAYGPAELARDLLAAGCGPREVVVVERLGHDDERVRRTDLAGAAELAVADPNTVVVLDPARALVGERVVLAPPVEVPGGWGLPTESFAHRDSQITKPEVRALALAHLAPRPGTLVWDVGAGSGSVAVECARFGAAVVAVEVDEDQVARCRANAEAHGVAVRTVTGRAPAVLADLAPDPDAVFVGGGTGVLEVLDVVAARTRARIAVALATIERVGPTLAALETAGWDAHARLVSVHDLVPLAGGHRLAPQNPVVLVTATRATEDDR